MQIFKLLVITLVSMAGYTQVFAQNDAGKKQDDEKRLAWVNMNMTSKQAAVDFIRTAYKDFTVFIPKHSMESGIYKRDVKYNDCELTIETEGRQQESSWKSDREFTKDIVVIDLDRVMLEGNDIKPSSPENAKGLFAGKNYTYFHKIPTWSILSGASNRDNDKFGDLHYEEHLQWAFRYLIEKCSAQ